MRPLPAGTEGCATIVTALTRWYGERGVGALTALPLIGGLAGTVSVPLTAGIAEHLD